MRIIDNINDIDFNQWNLLVKLSSTKSFFQTKDCYELYAANSLFMTPFFIGVEEEGMLKGIIVGYIQADGNKLKRFLSRRAIINSGPLLADDISVDALMELLNYCKKSLQRKAIYIEFRNFEDYSRYKDIFQRCGFEYVPHLNFHIDTTSEDVVVKNLGKSRKRDVKTSLREGAEIVNSPTMKDIHQFYEILHYLYEKKVKTPLYPMSFFEHLFQQPYSKFLLVRLNEKIVGGTVCVTLLGHSVYEWFACGEDGIYKNIYPSTVATYAGIIYAAQNGYNHFDMMGAGKPNESYGVREFKAKFGGKLVEHGRYKAVLSPFLYKIGEIGVKIIKRL